MLSEASDPGGAASALGWVHEAVLRDYPSLAGFDVYAAGPPALIEAIRASFPQHGLSADRLHFDSFDYAPRGLNACQPLRQILNRSRSSLAMRG